MLRKFLDKFKPAPAQPSKGLSRIGVQGLRDLGIDGLSIRSAAPRGTVLLLALLIMSSMLIASSGLSALILSSLQQTRAVDSGIVAYYAGESAVEDRLWTVRHETGLTRCAEGCEELDETACGNEPKCAWNNDACRPAATELPNRARTSCSFRTEEKRLYLNIGRDETAEVLLYDPQRSGVATGIDHVRLKWGPAAADPQPVLQVMLAGWYPSSSVGSPFGWWSDGGAQLYNALDTPVNKLDYVAPQTYKLDTPSDGADYKLQASAAANSKLFRLRFRAEKAPISRLEVTAYADESETTRVPLKSRETITGVGEFGGVRQQVVVRIPQAAPMSGLFDYVLFSECSLVKGKNLSPICL